MRVLRAMFSRKWILTTLIVFAGTALCARLGIWQLDRLDQRRTANAHFESVRAMPTLELAGATTEDLTAQEYRAVTARGVYDFENQVALRNRDHDGVLGYHLLTPLVLGDGTAVLVERGFIPAEGNAAPADWRKYDEPGEVAVSGILHLGQTEPGFGAAADPALAPGQTRLDFWIIVNLERIAEQLPYPLLPVFLQPDVDPNDDEPPIAYQYQYEVTEGPHLGYAGQWFTFAALLFFGYPFLYLPRQDLS
ncbi:MAG: SURF1 family protein [Chloroflexi bacterium]|nr:SURF1 family protein [Chloroflexota bacterium]